MTEEELQFMTEEEMEALTKGTNPNGLTHEEAEGLDERIYEAARTADRSEPLSSGTALRTRNGCRPLL